MITLHLYNTLTRKKDLFQPIDRNNVRLYVCGPTVYDNAHIGNARPVIVFDILYRLLCYIYGTSHVLYVRNITDVDDKINARAILKYPQLSPLEAIRRLTITTNAQFQEDVAMLGCLKPNIQPCATEYIAYMCALIEKLIERGHAYIASNHVLFSVRSMGNNSSYGELSHRTLDSMMAGARVEVASYKQYEMDFVLWKPSTNTEPGWKSPGGINTPGRPGWHIECSAMSIAKLLEPFGGGLSCDDPSYNIFDIHGGGIDLIFPHHENEIAQSCSALGTRRMANFWMHNSFLQVDGKKMSKSYGNFITICDLLKQDLPDFTINISTKIRKRWAGLSARFSMLQTHYREPINWTYQRFCEASSELYRWYLLLRKYNFSLPSDTEKENKLLAESLANDLNTWNAITLLRRFFKERNAHALGIGMNFIGLFEPIFIAEIYHGKNNATLVQKSSLTLQEINTYLKKRANAIKNKDWNKADWIRDFLAKKNILLTDSINPETGERITNWDTKHSFKKKIE